MLLRIDEVVEATGGSILTQSDEVEFRRVSIDSRSIEHGDLFVPLVGDRDGHEFVGSAVGAGAVGVLWSSELDPPDVGNAAVVRVSNTAVALTDIGRLCRSRISGPVVAITGSVGKTSAKDLMKAVLSQRFVVSASERSFNNEIGVPLTLANVADNAEAVILEMGSRGAGHIAELCAVAHPTIGVVLCVASAHLETFGSIEGVAQAKGELIAAVPRDGTSILNMDDPHVAAMATRSIATIVGFGEDAQIRSTNVRIGENLCAEFDLHTQDGSVRVTLGVAGIHHVSNALAAAAVGVVLGLTPAEIAAGLADASLSPWRMELRTSPRGVAVLNDAYNANPASVEAALRSFVRLPANRHVAVLGEMAELGESAAVEHRRIGELAASLGVQCMSVASPDYGVDDVPDLETAAERLGFLVEGDAVLVKGSRVAGLERLAAILLDGS